MDTAGAVITSLHGACALLVLVAAGVAAGWGLADHRRGARLSPTYDRVLWLLQLGLLAQVALGAGALLLGPTTTTPLHIFAGSVAVLLPAAVWFPFRRQRSISLVMSLTCIATIALGAVAWSAQP